VHRDKLVGAILIGDKNEFLEFSDLIANGIELSEKRLQLLRASQQAEPMIGKLVCSCNNVGQGNLEKAIAAVAVISRHYARKRAPEPVVAPAAPRCGLFWKKLTNVLVTFIKRKA
jgi:hypothetical protein